MSQATRAKTAKARATIAARYIRAGKVDSRAFDACFEMGDGEDVVRYLLARAVMCPKIADYARRAQWYKMTGGAVD